MSDVSNPMSSANWVEVALTKLADAAGDHPLLIGLLLAAVLISTALHAFSFAAHLLLGLSRYVRGQFSEIKNLKGLYRAEWRNWREETVDIFRFRSMSTEEIEVELKRHNIDPARTTQVLTAFSEAWLREQRQRRDTSKSTDERVEQVPHAPSHSDRESL